MRLNRPTLAGFLATFSGAFSLGSLAGCRGTTYVDHGLDFERHEVVTGRARSQTVLPGFLLGGSMADLAVVSVGRGGEGRLGIHALDGGGWAARVTAPLGRDVLFVDLAVIGGRERVILCRDGRLSWFDPDAATERPLLEVPARYGRAPGEGLPHVDVTRDVNRDGRDDLVLPDLDGFWVSTQASDGSFAPAVLLGTPEPFLDDVPLEEERSYREVGLTPTTIPRYLSRVHELDHDRDGRSDLVFWREGRLVVYLQDEQGAFDPVPGEFPVDVPLDSDGVYSHAFGYDGEDPLSLLLGFRAQTRRTVLHSFRDVNDDGIADLVTHSLEGRSLVRQRTTLAVHLGEPTPGGIRFAPEASATFGPRGSQPVGYALQRLEDLDGDGELEVVLVNVEAGLGDMVQALVAGSIDLDLYFFRAQGGVYADEPTVRWRVRPDSDLFGCRGPFFPTVLGADVNGDGLEDLLVGQSRDELRVHVGVPGPALFAEHPQGVAVALTADERNARVFDMNADGRDDVLIHHPSERGAHRVGLLIAR